ncbi:hypothetical protein GGR56DRAFT_688302 [Xylariaceae sp. FL0804]|nr:hypothetical protein GGR56DRAFT_688302 [Xylariaceae sp. FL0804]
MTSPIDPQAKVYSHINGSREELLDRFAVSELCKGWPVFRDASEWKNFRSLFCEDAYVWTTWSKRQHIDRFIEVSKQGKARGDFIMHRECGTLVDLNPSTGRAVGKMKATITQRFTLPPSSPGVEPVVFDVDCDSRFQFFCQRTGPPGGGEWRVKYVKLIYDKDKVVAVDGGRAVPAFAPQALARYPAGYRYLGAAQALLGHDVDARLPTIQSESDPGAANASWLDMYEKAGQWLDGRSDIDLNTGAEGAVAEADGAKKKNGHQNGHQNGHGNGHHEQVVNVRTARLSLESLEHLQPLPTVDYLAPLVRKVVISVDRIVRSPDSLLLLLGYADNFVADTASSAALRNSVDSANRSQEHALFRACAPLTTAFEGFENLEEVVISDKDGLLERALRQSPTTSLRHRRNWDPVTETCPLPLLKPWKLSTETVATLLKQVLEALGRAARARPVERLHFDLRPGTTLGDFTVVRRRMSMFAERPARGTAQYRWVPFPREFADFSSPERRALKGIKKLHLPIGYPDYRGAVEGLLGLAANLERLQLRDVRLENLKAPVASFYGFLAQLSRLESLVLREVTLLPRPGRTGHGPGVPGNRDFPYSDVAKVFVRLIRAKLVSLRKIEFHRLEVANADVGSGYTNTKHSIAFGINPAAANRESCFSSWAFQSEDASEVRDFLSLVEENLACLHDKHVFLPA